MTLHQYRSLDDEQQYLSLWNKAVQVAERENKDNLFVLYQYGDFYVEIKFPKNGCETVLKSFPLAKSLQPYLSKVNIGSIVLLNH